MVPDAVGLSVAMLGAGKKVVKPPRETWCAVKEKIAIGRAIMPNNEDTKDDPTNLAAAQSAPRRARE